MGVPEILSKKLGISNPEASMQKVSESLKESLEQLLQTKQMATVADVVKSLVNNDDNKNTNPFAPLKDLGIDVKSIIEGDRAMAQTALNELQKAREQILEEKAKNLEQKRNERLEELTVTEKLLSIITGIQNKTFEQQMQLLKDMYSKPKEKDKEDDIVNDFIKKLMMTLLEERLTKQNEADPKAMLKDYIQTVREFAGILGMNSHSAESEKWKYDLELKKIELEERKAQMELEERRKIEERKLETWNNFMSQLRELAPAAISAFSSRGSVQPQIQSQMPQTPQAPKAFRIICSGCGEDMITSNPDKISQCPYCGKPIGKAKSSEQNQEPSAMNDDSISGGVEV